MLLWPTLLILAPVIGQFAPALKPVISLHPPWTIVSQGQTVDLTCNGFHSYTPEKIKWYHLYHEKQLPREILGNPIRVNESGQYRCQAQDSPQSNPVSLVFSSAPLILQAPLSVFEGDFVVLRCQAKKKEMLNIAFFKDDKKLSKSSNFSIYHANLKDNGAYKCIGYEKPCCSVSSNTAIIQVEELFSRPVLTVSPHQPANGDQVTLTCETQLAPQRSDVQLQFRFFKDNSILGSGWSRLPDFQISSIRTKDSGSYWCEAGTVTERIKKQSLRSKINMRSIVPVSAPVLTLYPAKAKFREGDMMTLRCQVWKGSFPITYQFFHEDVLLKKITSLYTYWIENSVSFSLSAENSGNYYCTADNGLGPQRSKTVSLSVIVPVSAPVLTLHPAEAKVREGDIVTLYCEVQKGSFPITYQFLREGVVLKTVTFQSASWGQRPVTFSLTAMHSRNYYCTADNGLGPQRSEAVSLSVIVPLSAPVLTLHPAEDKIREGDMVTLRCEVQKGSFPIIYQFLHEGVFLKKIISQFTYLEERSVSFSLSAEHSGNYYCTADNGLGPQRSEAVSLSVIVPVSAPVLTLRPAKTTVREGEMVTLHCESQTGSPPIWYEFYHKDVLLGPRSVSSWGGASFSLYLTAEHSGNYYCKADNDFGPQHSEALYLFVSVPVSRPVLTLQTPKAQAVVGDMLELHCEALRGSPPILYRFYHEHVILGNNSALSGGDVSFTFFLTTEHSGSYSCEASNMLGAQHSDMVILKVTVPVSPPVLTLQTPRAQAVVGDVLELHCEALRGSPPIWYWFYHEDVTLGNSSAPHGGGASFNLSLTIEHSGNYSCEADNGLGAQRSEAVTLFVQGLAERRSDPVATGVTCGLLSMVGLATGVLLSYCWFSRKAGERPTSDPSRSPSNLSPQEPTYHNVPAWIELQPVYSNVNPRGGDVVYSEVRSSQEKNKHAATCSSQHLRKKEPSVIYSQVKVASTGPQILAASAPHR